MDFKGITWVGNVYQKFEAMCLEVEEIIVQDTAKYVENQVQTVGASVKKFYSDVVQDLLPPSSMDPLKEADASELAEEQYTAVCTFEKKTEGMNEEDIKLDKKLTEDSKVIAAIYKNVSHAPNFHGLHGGDNTFQPSFRNSAMGACSDLYSTHYNHGSIYKKSNLHVKRISRKDNVPPTVTSGTVTHMEIDLCRASTCCNLSDKDHESSCDQKTITSTPDSVEVSRCDSIERCNGIENESDCIPGVSTDTSLSHMITLIDSIGNNDLEISHSNSSSLSAGSNAADICMNDGVVSQAGSSMNVDIQLDEFPDKVVLVSHPGHSDEWITDTMNISTVVEQGRESIQHFNKVQIEESCVVVNRDELYFVSNKEGKRRPYKKKIQDAISSRMRSGRKQEYEQLAVHWYGDDTKSHQENVESPKPIVTMVNTKRSPTHDICESEWELL